MMKKKYTYDAFISYRHTELDKFAAENLHRQLEAFRLPGKISKKKDGRTKIERVFRDKDELPLTSNLEDPIMEALKESEYLIVICSPRLRESLWCKKEIETFIGLHGREKVFAVLIEGEPEESFPEELLYVEEAVQKPDGSTEIVKKPMEPLAADIRGKSRHAMKKAMRTEILRLLAPMFSLNYDDLRQRHRERKMKRILTVSLVGGTVCLLFGTVSTAMALRIQSQKRQIEAQTEEIRQQNQTLLENQAINLAEEAERKLEEGDRIGAIRTAAQALSEYEGITMPYTPRAQYVLTESLHVYDNGYYIKPQHQLKTAGVIDFMLLSPDKEILLTYDASDVLTVWDIGAGTIVEEITDISDLFNEKNCTFLGKDRIAYENVEGNISIYSIVERRVTDTLEASYPVGLYADNEGRYLLVTDIAEMILYDGASYAEIATYEADEGNVLATDFQFDEEGKFLVFQEMISQEGASILQAKEGLLCFYDLQEGTFCTPIPVGTNGIEQVRFDGDTAYVLLNYSGDDWSYIQATLLACRPGTGEILWKQEYVDCFGSYLFRPYAEGAENLLFTTSYDARLISEADGSEYARISLGSDTAGGGSYLSRDMFLLFTRSGEFYCIAGDTAQSYSFQAKFLCHSQNVKRFMVANDGYLVLPYIDNCVTVYDFSQGEDLTGSEDELQVSENDCLEYTEAVACAQEKGIQKAALARYVFYNADETLMFISYSDATLEIYDTSDMSLKGNMTNLKDDVWQFLGVDKEGNMLIGGYSYGYMLNPDLEPVAVIEGLVGVDKEANRVIIKDGSDQLYTAPIYTVEELLAKAQAFVLR
ncbi:MAG: TIR domain-containing protein [Lachnospiraceae bacterium]